MDLNQKRSILEQRTKDFVYSDRWEDIFRCFTGVGKTATILKTVDSLQARWIYAAPFHKVIEGSVKRSNLRNYDFVHLKGRMECCHVEAYRNLMKMGLDIEVFCRKCPMRNNVCEYYANIKKAYRERPNLAITHAHIQSFLPSFLDTVIGDGEIRSDYNVLIVDENPIGCFINEETISRMQLFYLRECCIMGEMDQIIIDLLTELLKTTLNYNAIMKIPYLTLKRLSISRKFTKSMSRLYDEHVIADIPKNILGFLHNVFLFMTEDKISNMIYYRDDELNLAYFNPQALNLNLPIIGLDGTASKMVWSRMLGREVTPFNIDYQYKNAYQLDGGQYPISSWTRYGDDTPKKLVSLIDKIGRRKKRNVLVCGTKSVINKVQKFITIKNWEPAIYYSLRSKNEFYKTCDTVVLSCEPHPPDEKIQSCVALSGWPEDVWRRIYTEEEMLQALGRIRQNIEVLDDGTQREEIEVFVLPSTGVKTPFSNLFEPSDDIEFKRGDEFVKILSKDNLELILDGAGEHLNREMTDMDIILSECPTSPNTIILKYNKSRLYIRRLFSILANKNLIINTSCGKYELTKTGRKKISTDEKNKRGWVAEGLCLS